MKPELLAQVNAWILDDPDAQTAEQLRELLAANNEAELSKHFSGFLQFGTAGAPWSDWTWPIINEPRRCWTYGRWAS